MMTCIIAFSSATSVSGLNCRKRYGVARELGAARIDDDQLGAVLHRVLDQGRRHRVIDRRVGADQRSPPRPASRPSPDCDTAPEPMPSSSAATLEAWHSRVQ